MRLQRTKQKKLPVVTDSGSVHSIAFMALQIRDEADLRNVTIAELLKAEVFLVILNCLVHVA